MLRWAGENSKEFLLGPIFVRPVLGQLIPEAGTVRTVLAIFGPTLRVFGVWAAFRHSEHSAGHFWAHPKGYRRVGGLPS